MEGDSNDVNSIKVYQGETKLYMENLRPMVHFTLKNVFLDE